MPELLKLQELDEHRGKPILVFCPTRKSTYTSQNIKLISACQTTADYMFQRYEAQRKTRGVLPWDPPVM